VANGDPLPVGADAVVRTEESRPEPRVGPPREVLALRAAEPGAGVVPRGYYLRAGSVLAGAGARLRLPMVGLLAAQGCVHPVCHRRARVAVLAVGDHLVGPGEAPVMHRERNAAGPTAVLPCLRWGATAHDLGAVAARDLPAALDRALTAPVVIVLGEPEGPVPRALRRAGVEPVFAGVALHPGKRVAYGVVRDAAGRAAHHVFHTAPGPVGVLTAVSLLVGPLVDRLHGGPAAPEALPRAAWLGPPHRPTDDRLWAVPSVLSVDGAGRLGVTPVDHRGKDDLFGFSRADALALLPPRNGPWNGGEVVEVAPLGCWPPG
jgi:molybdopterin molybdotransferase